MMEIITYSYIIALIYCLVVVFLMFGIPPVERRKYNKYDKFERIKDISNKHNIMKPRYLMFNLGHHYEDAWYYKWISWRSEKIPRNTGDPILFLKKSITSIDNKEDKKVYIEWLLNQLSAKKAEKKSSHKDHYLRLENTVHEIYDSIDNSGFDTKEEINEIIENLVINTDENNSSKYNIETRRVYLKTFIEQPHLTRSKLVKVVCENNSIIDKDKERLLNQVNPPSVLYGWEKNLREALKSAEKEKLARKLKR